MKCIGFGEYERKCTNEAGSSHSKLWCQRCDDLRRISLTRDLEEIAASFKTGKP